MTVAVQRTRRRQPPEETRRQILDSAQAILREASYRELSVEAVMARTGHTRTVFYRHFEDVPALVLALITEVGGEMVELGRKWALTESASPQDARERLAGFVDFYVRHGTLVRAVAEASHHDHAVNEAYSAMVEGFVALTTQAIEARVQKGDIEPLDAPQIARALVRMLNGYLDEALGREPFVDPDRVLDAVSTIWSRVLFPRG